MKFTKLESDHLIEDISQFSKENHNTELASEITKGKPFSITSAKFHDQSHNSNYELRNQVFNQIGNKTTVEFNPSKSTIKKAKIDDIYVDKHLIERTELLINKDKKQTLKIVLNKPHFSQNKKNHLKNPKQNVQEGVKQKGRRVGNQVKGRGHNWDALEKETPHLLVNQQLKQDSASYEKDKKNLFLQVTKADLIVSPSVFEECSHIMKQIRQDYNIQQIFNRHESCACSEPVTFNLPTKHPQSLWSQKTSRFLRSEFKIFLNKKGKNHELGTLKSNFVGSVYNFYPKDHHGIYFSILFKSKKLHNQDSFRYCEVYINKGMYSGQNNSHQLPNTQLESLESLFLLNKRHGKNTGNRQILKLHSQIPIWSQSNKSYNLNFSKQTIFASAKNTILVDQNNRQTLKFYKNSYLTYNLTFSNPLSWIAAYAFALASTDFKLSSQ